MTPTAEDVGRRCVKRDNPRRQFQIVAVTSTTVTLRDLLSDQTFTITDPRTYDLTR